jgi:hypothetical protein
VRIYRLIRHTIGFCAVAVTLAACGGSIGVPAAAPGLGSGAPGTPARFSWDRAAHRSVQGTYDGTFSQRIGSTTVRGVLQADLKQSGSKLTGKFLVTVNGKYDFTFPVKGTVSQGAHGARLRFTPVNVGGSRNAKCKGSVVGRKLRGSGYVPPTSSKQPVYIKFKGKKT